MLFVVIEITILLFFFFNDTATTEIYTLSLHDALPICEKPDSPGRKKSKSAPLHRHPVPVRVHERSEEHTSELQSHSDLVCRLLLEKKKQKSRHHYRVVFNLSTHRVTPVKATN